MQNKFDEFEIYFIIKFYNNFNIVRIDTIIDALKYVQLILQFNNFMNLYIREMIVNKNAIKFDIFILKKLIF